VAPDAELTRAVAGIRALFAGAACSCALVDDGGDRLTFVASDGAGADRIVGVELPVGRGIAGWAALSGQPIAVRDVRSDPRFARDVAESTDFVPTSILAAPMFDAEGEVVGVVSVLDPGVHEASDWTLSVLGTLASQLASLVTARRSAAREPEAVRWEALGRRIASVVDEHRP